jgi:hypothetical protein
MTTGIAVRLEDVVERRRTVNGRMTRASRAPCRIRAPRRNLPLLPPLALPGTPCVGSLGAASRAWRKAARWETANLRRLYVFGVAADNPFGRASTFSGTVTQGSFERVQMCRVISILSGSSRVPTEIPVIPGPVGLEHDVGAAARAELRPQQPPALVRVVLVLGHLALDRLDGLVPVEGDRGEGGPKPALAVPAVAHQGNRRLPAHAVAHRPADAAAFQGFAHVCPSWIG